MYTGMLAQNKIPQISNVTYTWIDPTTIDINYDLVDPDNAALEVQLKMFYASGNMMYQEESTISSSGDLGFPINIGSNKKIRVTLPNTNLGSKILLQITASDREPLLIEDILNGLEMSRLQNDLTQLQGRRNALTDASHLTKSRNYITSEMAKFLPTTELKANVPQGNCINYMYERWGNSKPNHVYIIDAHYDTFSQSPGADDNGSGVVGVMEALRLLSPYASKHTLRFLFFDLEEAGLVGSNLYVNNQLNRFDSVKAVINFEMIGYYSNLPNTQELPTGFNQLFPEAYNAVINNQSRGDFITNTGNTFSSFLKNKFAAAAIKYVPNLKVISLEVPGNGAIVPDLRRSDHASFWDKNMAALMITDGANFRNKNYHTTRDSIQTLNFNFMSQVIKTSIATIAELAEVSHSTSKDIFIQIPTATNNVTSENALLFQSANSLVIELPEYIADIQLHINDMTGKQILHGNLSKQLNQSFTVNLKNCKPGVYLVHIQTRNAGSMSKKIIIHPW